MESQNLAIVIATQYGHYRISELSDCTRYVILLLYTVSEVSDCKRYERIQFVYVVSELSDCTRFIILLSYIVSELAIIFATNF